MYIKNTKFWFLLEKCHPYVLKSISKVSNRGSTSIHQGSEGNT